MKFGFKQITVICAAALLLCSCGSSTASKAVEQARLSVAGHDYQAALDSLKLAVSEGARTKEILSMTDILSGYLSAESAFNADDMAQAEAAMASIPAEYVNYSIKGDIDTLNASIVSRKSEIAAIDSQIAGVKIFVQNGDYVSAEANIAELKESNLTQAQRTQTEELDLFLQAANEKINEANSKAPGTAYTPSNPQPAAPRNRYSPYLFDSDTDYITDAYLDTKTQDEVRLILNEIYARHGYIFSTERYSRYFSSKSWYVPISSSAADVEAQFNSVERTNRERITAYEKARGWR